MILTPQKPAYLQIIFPQADYNFDDNTVVTFSINNYEIKLFKNLSNTNSQICIFEYLFGENELKKFIHELTSKKEADIELNDRVTSISLNGTSISISAILKYIEENHITFLPEPFNDNNASLSIKTAESNIINDNNTDKPLFTFSPKDQNKKTNDESDSKLFYIIGYFILFLVIYKIVIQPILRKRYFNNQINRAIQLCFREIEDQSTKLFIKRDQLIFEDHYGTIVYDKWFTEKQRFIKSRIEPLLYDNNLLSYYPYIEKSIQDKITLVASVKPTHYSNDMNTHVGSDLYHPNMNPIDYEFFCAKKLREIGWEAQASGGLGADIEAIKNGIRLVLKCNLYTKSVGKQAVQQVNTAKTFYHADYAAVVSNANFTNDARQIALSTKTALLHHDELQRYADSLTH